MKYVLQECIPQTQNGFVSRCRWKTIAKDLDRTNAGWLMRLAEKAMPDSAYRVEEQDD